TCGFGRLLRKVERRAEGAVRSDRTAPLGPRGIFRPAEHSKPTGRRANARSSSPRQHRRNTPPFHVDGAMVKLDRAARLQRRPPIYNAQTCQAAILCMK